MTAEQLVWSLLIAIVTAVATAFFNNFWAESRQKKQWEREKEERRAQYRRLRLEEKVRPVEAWIRSVVELSETLRLALGPALVRDPDMDNFQRAYDSAKGQLETLKDQFAAIDTMLLAVGDRQLTDLLEDFYRVWTEMLVDAARLYSFGHPLAPDQRQAYQDWRNAFLRRRGVLDEKATLLFLKIDSMLEVVGG